MGFRALTGLKRHYAGQAGRLITDFYLPVLSAAVRYDRQAGYFDSVSLVQIAAGLAAFIRGSRGTPTGGHPPMRLITGATWSADDIEAYQRGQAALSETLDRTLLNHFAPSDEECARLGLPAGWRPETDQIARHRLGTLAWMVGAGLLEVRIALPLDHAGRPYRPGRYGALYHPKAGILYDAADDRLAFQGSVNETGAAWTRNREKFQVVRSWESAQDAEDVLHEIEEFETIWAGRDVSLLVLPLPRAVTDYLAAFVPPDGPPEHDPLEPVTAPIALRDRIEAHWLLEAPKQPGGAGLVLHPLWADGRPLAPFPHQARVFERATGGFPSSFLFCDEVGLGKTIEAGLALRALLLRGEISRALIIAPRNLIRQWMEELREKLALTAWFYDGRGLTDVGGRVRESSAPLEEDGLVIVSRHLIARADRRDEVRRVSRPWDLVIVDEAHAARRQVFRKNAPNQLLGLLEELVQRRSFRSLWLLTATPMQLDPREVYDLLILCGLDQPDWGEWRSLRGFEGYFDQLAVFAADKRVREPVIRMTRTAVIKGADDLDATRVPSGWSAFQWQQMVRKVKDGLGLGLALANLKPTQAQAITPYLSRQTPLAVHMFRHTRATLRAYQERGLLVGALAVRIPEDLPVEFATSQEAELYGRIDRLCSEFYRVSDLPAEERAGIGFLMAVFRKRLASSFMAFQKSLERRKALIDSIQDKLWDLTDALRLVQPELDEDDEGDDAEIAERWVEGEARRLQRLYEDPQRRNALNRESAFIQAYITDLRAVSMDSKFGVFQDRLTQILAEGPRQRIIVFTQYLDTLDFIRDRLIARLGDRLACYSGRGGEVWDGKLNTWRVVEKSEVKERTRADHPHAIRVLLGTDAASEGLNLQQFSVLVNYDLPWNPMRVEQRIGRIDRIGQEAAQVRVLNLYVRQTIEEDAYDTLKNRIGVFQDVVGPLQPILAEMPRVFRQVARGEMELDEARRVLDASSAKRPRSAISSFGELVKDDDFGTSSEPPSHLPATQDLLAGWCLAHPAPGMRVITVPEPGLDIAATDGRHACLGIAWASAPAFLGIDGTEEVLATFDGALADRHPPTGPSQTEDGTLIRGREGVRLLTWGDPYLHAWLLAIRGAPPTPDEYTSLGLEDGLNPFSNRDAP
jgi:superfamily II DNA or RNA helicase